MSGLRVVLFPINSDAGLGLGPVPPLAFFLGGAPLAPSPLAPPPPRQAVGLALALSEEDSYEEALA